MKKKMLFLYPKHSKTGSPAFERIYAFHCFYSDVTETYKSNTPENFFEFVNLVFFIYKNKIDFVFLSMPPFRNWLLFLFPFCKVIFDIRDGWSIAMRSGYGGTTKNKHFKAKIAYMIEKFAVKQSVALITCTPGLVKYYKEEVKCSPLLCLNGVSKESIRIVNELNLKENKNETSNTLKAICAGKFSEYGVSKCKTILDKLNDSHSNDIDLVLLGSDFDKNKWLFDYIKKNGYKINLEIKKRVDKELMFKEILESDLAITVVRDPNYEFGTKVFDYILCNKKILNYFEDENNFYVFFKNYFHDSDSDSKVINPSRECQIKTIEYELLKVID